jgi:DNA-binding NtrC family response regulator
LYEAVLEGGEIVRVGGDKWIKVEVRVIAATRRDLDRAVAAGRFRDDLFHRLAVARVELPPLRRRGGDVALIAQTMWQELGGDLRDLPRDVLARWEEDPWPGNIRELRNAVARQLALGDLASAAFGGGEGAAGASAGAGGAGGGAAASEGAPTSTRGAGGDAVENVLEADLPFIQARARLVAEFERRYVERVLRVHGGDVAKAAAASGIGRRYFQMLRAKSRG